MRFTRAPNAGDDMKWLYFYRAKQSLCTALIVDPIPRKQTNLFTGALLILLNLGC